MRTKALGMIEVMGYVAAIQVADSALKSADVKLLGVEKVSAGIVTVKLQGDISAVNSATESGVEAAKKLGKLLTYTVIARTHEETENILENEHKTFKMEKQLEKMKVMQLRAMVKNMNIKNLTKKEIKFATKEKLIEQILKHSREEEI